MSMQRMPELRKKFAAPTSSGDLLHGTVEKITYHNPQNGFAVIRARISPSDVAANGCDSDLITIAGSFPPMVANGLNFVARGVWSEHPKYGRQFKAYAVTETRPSSVAAIEAYLGSGVIKGIGPSTAQKIVKKFGEATLDILDQDPDRLGEIPGIGKNRCHEIAEQWEEKRLSREVTLFFQAHNIPLSTANRIYREYGLRAIEVVKDNPYVLVKDVWGIGFPTADNIASHLGVTTESPLRIASGINHTLNLAAQSGHTYLPFAELLEQSTRVLRLENTSLIKDVLQTMCEEKDLILAGENAYNPINYYTEQILSRNISNRLLTTAHNEGRISRQLCEKYTNSALQIKRADGQAVTLQLSDEQKAAVRLAATAPLLVITGGPGCGKTTVLQVIVRMLGAAGLDVKLASPTGRAAQRMSEVCSRDASTIHRMLKFDPVSGQFVHHRENLLGADVLIIDESSMIDLALAASLMEAVSLDTRIILVGDVDQLPSVGAGRFLADLLDVEEIPRVRLSQLFRRDQGSLINDLAHEINRGKAPVLPDTPDQNNCDCLFLEAASAAGGAQMIEKLVVEAIPRKFSFSPAEITVLTPMNQGPLGVIALNKLLQAKITPVTAGIPFVKVGDLEFHLGDRVCQRVNNYNIHPGGVFNGDQGIINGVDTVNRILTVRLWDGRDITYAEENLRQLDLAYALTIHRSQGSEMPVVVLALHNTHHVLLERQLVYTAVTRAKKLLVIVGNHSALEKAVRRSSGLARHSGLTKFIKEKLECVSQ